MRVKLCQQCSYQLHRKAKKCPWCKSPVKKRSAFLIWILAILIFPVFAAWFQPEDEALIPLPPEPAQPKVVKMIKAERPKMNDSAPNGKGLQQGFSIQELGKSRAIKPAGEIKKPRGNISILYVQERIVNLRKSPSLESRTFWKLKMGQRLTQVSRSGNWLQVQADDAGGNLGWVHASLVGKTKPPPPKPGSEQKAFKIFRKSFDRFNFNIKSLKGMAFFNDVKYLDRGVIQITATDILLSAPKKYREKYLMTLMEMWLEVKEPTLPAAVRIVDTVGRLRMEEVWRK